MSYDVSLRPAGTDPKSAEGSRLDAETVDNQRVQEALSRLRVIDPSADIEERCDDRVLTSFVVVESARLPYLEVGPFDGMLSMSTGSRPVDLYRSLHDAANALHASGYAMFDHQLGCDLEPAESFREFMMQHREMWDSQEAFEQWLSATEFQAQAGSSTTIQQPRRGSSALTTTTVVLVAIWGAYKLHQAGYF